MRSPSWRGRADAWAKLLAAVVLAYVIIARVFAFFAEVRDLTLIAIGATLLAYLFYPVVHWLNLRLPLWAALTITYVGALTLTLTGLFYVSAPLMDQVRNLSQHLPQLRQTVTAFLTDPNNPYLAHLPPPIRSYLDNLPVAVEGTLQHNIGSITASFTSVLFSAVTLGAVLIAMPVVSIYMLAESSMIKRWFLQRLPARQRETAAEVLEDVNAAVGGFIRGQLIVAACVAVLVSAALLIIGVPYALLAGALAGIADIIPYIGPFVGAVPAVIAAAIAGGWLKVAVVIGSLIVVNQLEAHLLSPRIIGRTVQLSPLVVIFALLIGGSLYGLTGLIVSVPVAGIVRVFIDHFVVARPVRRTDVKPGLSKEPRVEAVESQRLD
jgi:predicted PurR-regulated permease PerM